MKTSNLLAVVVLGTCLAFASCKNCVECEDINDQAGHTTIQCNEEDPDEVAYEMNQNANPGEYWVCTERD